MAGISKLTHRLDELLQKFECLLSIQSGSAWYSNAAWEKLSIFLTFLAFVVDATLAVAGGLAVFQLIPPNTFTPHVLRLLPFLTLVSPLLTVFSSVLFLSYIHGLGLALDDKHTRPAIQRRLFPRDLIVPGNTRVAHCSGNGMSNLEMPVSLIV